MTILLNGKPIAPKASQPPAQQLHLGKHRLLTTDQVEKRHPSEPFPPIAVFRNDTVEHRLSVASDLKMWVEQKLDEMVPLVDESEWLRLQLRNPALEGHRMRADAQARLQDMTYTLSDLACDVALLEAHSDRIWQSLQVNERESMAKRWVCDVTDDRLILNAWTNIAPVGFRWPINYRLNRKWFHGLPEPVLFDMERFGLTEGVILGIVSDPFEEDKYL